MTGRDASAGGTDRCPTLQILRLFSVGELPFPLQEVTARHLDGCPACSTAMESFDGREDVLLALIRRSPTKVELPEAAFQRMVGAIETIDWPELADMSPRNHRTQVGERFRVLRPHATGGIGRVSIAFDEELNREVAFKEIRPELADDPRCRGRFLLEAEVTGHLEHPGIVPVYSLGHDDRGRPFYAMRFVHGTTLGDAIARFHRRDGMPGQEPAEPLPTLRPLLGRFVDACNAVAYAHSKGVLHRDLKPANLMLGPFGETLVVDWGLAKLFKESDDDSGTGGIGSPSMPIEASANEDFNTRTGRAVGTLAYASPEQAAGDLERMGPAADVYSLGATLYHLLTGQMAFLDRDSTLVLDRIRRGDFPLPRAVLGTVARPLEAICLKAMALEPARRYSSPLELASDVERWLADASVEAYRSQERLRERLARWTRRNLATVVWMTAIAVVIAAGLTVGAWLLARERERADRLGRDVAGNLHNVGLLQATTGQPEEALATLGKVLFLRQGLARRRNDAISFVDLAETHMGIGSIHLSARKFEVALESFQAARQLFEKAARLKADDFQVRRDMARVYNNIGALFIESDRPTEAEPYHDRSLEIFEGLVKEYPDVLDLRSELSASYNNTGNLQRRIGERAEKALDHKKALEFYKRARRSLERAIELRAEMVRLRSDNLTYRRDLGATHYNLGILLENLHLLPEAEAAYRLAVAEQRVTFSRAPGVVEYRKLLCMDYANLALVQIDLGRHADAAASALAHREVWPENPDEQYSAAVELALCIPLVGTDPGKLTADQESQRRRYADEAMRTLQRAIAAGFGDVGKLRMNRDLDPLRERDDFKEIVSRFAPAKP